MTLPFLKIQRYGSVTSHMEASPPPPPPPPVIKTFRCPWTDAHYNKMLSAHIKQNKYGKLIIRNYRKWIGPKSKKCLH